MLVGLTGPKKRCTLAVDCKAINRLPVDAWIGAVADDKNQASMTKMLNWIFATAKLSVAVIKNFHAVYSCDAG